MPPTPAFLGSCGYPMDDTMTPPSIPLDRGDTGCDHQRMDIQPLPYPPFEKIPRPDPLMLCATTWNALMPIPARRRRRRLATLLLLVLAALTCPAADDDDDTPDAPGGSQLVIQGATVEARAAAFVKACASLKPGKATPKDGMGCLIARLLTGTDTGYAQTTITVLAEKTLAAAEKRLKADPKDGNALDPFDKHALINGWLIAPDRFPAPALVAMKRFVALHAHKEWRGYGAMNYRVMKDGSGYIAAERWPDLVDADGLDAAAIKAATGRRMFSYFDEITHRNLSEYNAPIYFITDLMAIRMLAEFALDAEMRKRAAMTMDWMLVNLACSWNQGYYVTSSGRSKYWGSSITSPDTPGAAGTMGWIYFGAHRPINAAAACNHHTFWLAYPGTYRLPAIIAAIGSDRTKSFAGTETVLLGKSTRVAKYTWMTPTYGLASQWELTDDERDGLYKEARRHMLKWLSDKPIATFSIQQENILRPYRPADVKKNAFGYGENPWHQILQHEGTQIGLHDVPERFPFYRLYVPFIRSGAIVKRIEKDGWVFCHGGSMVFGFRPLAPYTWGKVQEDCDVLWCDARRSGWALETSELAPFAGGGVDAELDRFAAAVTAKTSLDATGLAQDPPVLRYTSLSGHVLSLTFAPFKKPYAGQRTVDGTAVDYPSFKLMENPWVRQEVNGDILSVQHGAMKRIWNFKEWTADPP